MRNHLKVMTALLIAVAPMATQAGGLAPAIEETPPVVIADVPNPTSSATNLIVPLIGLALIGIALGSSGDTSGASGGAKDIVTQ